MKQFVIAGTLVGVLAFGGSAFAQAEKPNQPPPPPPKPAAGAPKTTPPAGDTQTPAKKKPAAHKEAAGSEAGAHTAPNTQPGTTTEPTAQDTAIPLGTVRLPRASKADGKELPAGTYQLRLTKEEARPDARGSSEVLERWVEFVQGGKVVGREIVTIIPAAEAKMVVKDTPPPPGGSKVQILRGGYFMRVWVNRGGDHYLVHLPV